MRIRENDQHQNGVRYLEVEGDVLIHNNLFDDFLCIFAWSSEATPKSTLFQTKIEQNKASINRKLEVDGHVGGHQECS